MSDIYTEYLIKWAKRYHKNSLKSIVENAQVIGLSDSDVSSALTDTKAFTKFETAILVDFINFAAQCDASNIRISAEDLEKDD